MHSGHLVFTCFARLISRFDNGESVDVIVFVSRQHTHSMPGPPELESTA